MFEELITSLVDFWNARITLKTACALDSAWEVIASIEEFEKASDSIKIFINKINSAILAYELAPTHL